jgi:ubiquinone/menaquinone biosynthesis C-methylase UbiE
MRSRLPPATIARMTAITREISADGYVLGRDEREYERLRMQARAFEPATGRLLDAVGLGRGASCLDAGCGPGETMRLMAQRVGPRGRVIGIDIDDWLGRQTVKVLHAAGHRQCAFERVDVAGEEPIPGAPFDLVYARLLLLHLPDPLPALRRLWDAVAPGGHLLVQDYDLRSIDVSPPLATLTEFTRVIHEAFTGAGRHIDLGHRLPLLMAEADIGWPDGTDVTGRLQPLAECEAEIASVYSSLLPGALALGVTTEEDAEEWLDAFARDVKRFPYTATLMPLMMGAWKRKVSA